MELSKIVQWLDELFELSNIKEKHIIDYSMIKRKHLIRNNFYKKCCDDFLVIMNGLAYKSSEQIENICFATFLSDNVIHQLDNSKFNQTLLIVHHLYDMTSGTPEKMNGVPFHFINEESICILEKRKISIYAVHLPLDLQKCKYNTSKALLNRITNKKVNISELRIKTLPNIGYILEDGLDINIFEKFKKIRRYGNKNSNDLTVVVGGVISNVNILQELEEQNIGKLVCGDVLLCVESERFYQIWNYLDKCNIDITCLTHELTELYALSFFINCDI